MLTLVPNRDATLAGAITDLQAGQRSAVDLVRQCLAAIDAWEPKVHAFVFIDAEGALALARQRDEERQAGRIRGPLHGIPLAIKDIFDVAGWPTAAGFKPWANRIADQDAPHVARLRAAGAIFLGKTVTTQWASFDPPVTRNPWNPDRTPGGSSSGSAAGAACGMFLGALGSQTGGSLTRPASFCGVASCKPTHGRSELEGVIPLSPSMDHVGPIARTVTDLAILLDALSGTQTPAGMPLEPVFPGMVNPLPRPPRLARVRGLFHDLAEPAVREFMDRVTDALTAAGAVLSEPPLPPRFGDIPRMHRVIMATEAAAFHEERIAQQRDAFEPKVAALIDEGLSTRATDYLRCRAGQQAIWQDLRLAFNDVDAAIVPATTGPAPDRSTTGNPAFQSPWSYLGLPTISFPITLDGQGLPLAVQVAAPPWLEGHLFRVAAWCERVLQMAFRTAATDPRPEV